MKQLIIIILTGLTAFSCSSVQMVPQHYSVEKPDETIAAIDDPPVEIYMEHLSKSSGQLVFDLQVVNTGLEMIKIEPTLSRIYGANEPFPEAFQNNQVFAQAVLHSPGHGHPALSEEQVNTYFKRKIRAKQAAQVAVMLVGIALAVNDAVQDAEDSQQEFWTENDAIKSARRDVLTFTGLLAADLVGGALESEKFKTLEDLEFLPREYLHEELIFPGGSSRGKVFFNCPTEYIYYRVILQVAGNNYIFDFRRPDAAERRILRRVN